LWACTKSGRVVDRSQVMGLEADCQCRLHQAMYHSTQDGQSLYEKFATKRCSVPMDAAM